MMGYGARGVCHGLLVFHIVNRLLKGSEQNANQIVKKFYHNTNSYNFNF